MATHRNGDGEAAARPRARTRARQGGFSLIELMVVITILGLLGTIVVANVIARQKKATKDAARVKMGEIAKTIEFFQMENNGKYPQSIEELLSADENGLPWLKGGQDALLDPWKNPFQYSYSGSGDPPFELTSYGSDGAPGGSGDAEDLIHGQKR